MWDAMAFTHDREHSEPYGLVQKCFRHVVASALLAQHASKDHSIMDDTLIQPRTSLKSFRPKDGSRDLGSGD